MEGTMRWSVGVLAISTVLGTGCAREAGPDAYGNVEAVETVVSAQVGGQVTALMADEGRVLAKDDVVGTIDTTALALERRQVDAQRAVAAARRDEGGRQRAVVEGQRDGIDQQRRAAEAQRAALDVQLEIARRMFDRTQRLFGQQAATSVQLDQAERDVKVLERQIEAQRNQVDALERQADTQTRQLAALDAQRATVDRQVSAVDAQAAQVDDRMHKAQIVNPAPGTVLVQYARTGEVVQPGQPLYKVASLEAVDVRAYVTEPQLASLKVGQPVQVGLDAGGSVRQLPGTVTWVSAQAEFTPTPIQTREERADLVYAVKVRVDNTDHLLKIGMPVDVEFTR